MIPSFQLPETKRTARSCVPSINPSFQFLTEYQWQFVIPREDSVFSQVTKERFSHIISSNLKISIGTLPKFVAGSRHMLSQSGPYGCLWKSEVIFPSPIELQKSDQPILQIGMRRGRERRHRYSTVFMENTEKNFLSWAALRNNKQDQAPSTEDDGTTCLERWNLLRSVILNAKDSVVSRFWDQQSCLFILSHNRKISFLRKGQLYFATTRY